MKKLVALFFCMTLLSGKASAISPFDWSPLSTYAPQLCAQCTQEQIQLFKSALEVIKQAQDREGRKQILKDTIAHSEKYVIAKAKGLLSKGLNKLSKKDDSKPISYTRMIKKTKTDLNDVEAVRDAFKRYFLYVPSKNAEIQASYSEKREQFVEDTTLELYITAKEMDAEVKIMLSQLELIQQCIIMGDIERCKAQGLEEYNCQKDDGTEDEMCYRRNALMVADIYDTIVKYNEYLMAMRAQYEAVRTLGQGAKPKLYNPESNKTSSLQTYSLTQTAYASEEIENESLVLDELPKSKYEFDDNNKIGLPTPMEGKENDIVAPSLFYEAQKHISAASESHDLKQMLPDFKKAFDSYHDMENMHKKYVKELQSSQECVLNYLAQRYDNAQKVWLDNCSVEDDGYVCAYNPAKSVTDTSESEGIYDTICPLNRTNKCYKLAPTAYNEIGGMSGWLINMYLNAKDKLSDTEVKQDDYVIYSSDTKPQADVEPTEASSANSVETLKNLVEDNRVLTDKYLEDMRTLNLLSFSIGSVANDEINNDVNGASKFNVKAKPFPLWNDQKNFYNQYIDGKYENIINYLQNAPLYKNILSLGLEINKTYEYRSDSDPDLISKGIELFRQEIAKRITDLLNLNDSDVDERVKKIALILEQEDAKLKEISNLHKQKIQELEQQRINLYKQLEDINVKEADLHTEVEKQNSVINYAENYNEVAELGAEEDKNYQTKGNPHKTNEEIFKDNIKEQSDKELTAEEARSAAKKELAGLTSNKKDIIGQIKNIESKIDALKSEYVLAYYNAEQKYKKDLAEEMPDNLDKILNETQKTIVNAIQTTTVLAEAERLTEYLRQYTIKKATEAKAQIDALKTDDENSLYYAKNNNKVVKIHSDMITKITEPDVDDVVAELGLDKATAEALKKYAEIWAGNFSNLCDEVSCYQPDASYFVGLVEQKLDFSAPKAAVDFSSAPMREIFHFAPEDMDYVDYYGARDFILDFDNQISAENQSESLPLETDGVKVLLIENSLLESGIKLPEIWKLVLSHRPFVQKELDLKQFLNHGGIESNALVRSGIYPCKVGTKVIDVVPDGSGKIHYAELAGVSPEYANQTLPQCRTIGTTKDGYIDTQADSDANKINMNAQIPVSALGASELGNILDYAEINVKRTGINGLPLTDMFGTLIQHQKIQYLTFRKEFIEALRFTNNYMNKFSTTEDIKFSAEYYLYKRVFPQANQLGDYLLKVDMERAGLEAKEKIKNNLYSANLDDTVIVNSLYKSFAAMGYDFDREKFDLSQEDYYQQASNILNARKDENLREAKEILADSRLTNLSDEMEKRKENLLNQIALLELDSEETVSVNIAETLEELAERIKTEKADRAVQNKKIEEANRSLQEKLQQSEAPYCAVYAQ